MAAPRRAPGPRGLPLLGSALDFRASPVGFMIESWRRYGDLVRFDAKGLVAHLVVRPAHVAQVLVEGRRNYAKGRIYEQQKLLLGEGLITSEGALWERQHALLQPLFTPRKVEQFLDIMTGATRAMLERWAPLAGTGRPIPVDLEMARLTGNIIVRLLFDRDLDDDTEHIDEAFQYCIAFIDARSANVIALPMWVPLPSHVRFRRHLATIHRYIDERVAEHRRGEHKGTLLAALVEAADERTGERMSERQVRDELVTLFVAGYQTTMHTLTWTWYLLDRNPEADRALREEQEALIGDRTPTADDIGRADVARRVFLEAMRLYPPIKVVVREAILDDEIDGFAIPKGSLVIVSPYITQRHPGLWPDPEAFDPGRFTPERSEGRERYAYIPFLAGERKCLGDKFALQEAAVVLTMVTQRYRLRLVPGHPVETSMDVKTWPLHGMPMTVERRA